MTDAAVDDMDLADSCRQRFQAGLDLGNHPLVDHPADQFCGTRLGSTCVSGWPHRFDLGGFRRVRQHDQLFGSQVRATRLRPRLH